VPSCESVELLIAEDVNHLRRIVENDRSEDQSFGAEGEIL
jgi:hypothetical protein